MSQSLAGTYVANLDGAASLVDADAVLAEQSRNGSTTTRAATAAQIAAHARAASGQGPVVLAADPADSTHAARKGYVDAQRTAAESTAAAALSAHAAAADPHTVYALKSGAAFSGAVTVPQPALTAAGADAATTSFVRDHTSTLSFPGALARTALARAGDVLRFHEFGSGTTAITTGQAAIEAATMAALLPTGPRRLQLPAADIAMRAVPRIFARAPRFEGTISDIQDGATRLSCYPDGGQMDALMWFGSVRTADVRNLLLSHRGRTALSLTIDAAARTITRTSGSWITDGFTAGRSVRFAAISGANAALNGKDLVVEAATALVLTVTQASLDASPAVTLSTQSGITGATATMPGLQSLVTVDAGASFQIGPLRASITGLVVTLEDGATWTSSGAAAGRTVTFTGWATAGNNNVAFTIASVSDAALTLAAGSAVTAEASRPLIYATFNAGPALSSYQVIFDRVHTTSQAGTYTTGGDFVFRNTKWWTVSNGTLGDAINSIQIGGHFGDYSAALVNGAGVFGRVERLLLNGHVSLTHGQHIDIRDNSFEENWNPADPPRIVVGNVPAGSTTAANSCYGIGIRNNQFQDDTGGNTGVAIYTAPVHRPTAGLGGAESTIIELNGVRSRRGFELGAGHALRANTYFGRWGDPEQWGIRIPAADVDGREMQRIFICRTENFGTLFANAAARAIVDERAGTLVNALDDAGLPQVRRGGLRGPELWRVELSANRTVTTADAWQRIDTFLMRDPWRGGTGAANICLAVQNTGSVSRTVRARFVVGQVHNPRHTISVLSATLNTVRRAWGSWDAEGYAAGQIVRFDGFGVAGNNNTDRTISSITDGGLSMVVTANMVAATTQRGARSLLRINISGGNTLTRRSGSWVADGWAVGQIVYLDGLTSGPAANNRLILTVSAVTADALTVTGASLTNMGGGVFQTVSAYRGTVVALASVTVPAGGYAPLTFDDAVNLPQLISAEPALGSLEVLCEGSAADITFLGRSDRGGSTASWRIVE